MRKQFRGNWPLYTAWLMVLMSTVAMTLFYGVESSNFFGIAETREIVVNYETPVEIKRINVTEGQSVDQGMLMVELNSPDLMLKINHISHQLDQLKAQKGVDKSEILSGIRQLKAEKAAKESEIENQITQLENQYAINKSLLSGLKSIPGNSETGGYRGSSPIELKIRSLKKELSLSVNPLNIQIELLQKTLDNSDDPIRIQVERLENELNLLREENSRLNIYAQISGIIGSVNYKPGEKVSPFSPILTLHTKTPSFIKGYIYENTYSGIAMGDCVTVASLSSSDSGIEGCVVGIGARIVEYPIRLRKHPDIQVWGREVVIQIPEDNDFILGEKVHITSLKTTAGITDRLKQLFIPSESIAGVVREEQVADPVSTLSVIPLETSGIEGSALVYLEDMDRYMLLSDDTPENRPLVFLMTPDGRITEEVSIIGLDSIDDMESVAEGETGVLYIASSFSTNKKGNTKAERKRLVSVMRKGDRFTLIGSVDLYSILKTCAEADPGSEWAGFIIKGISGHSLDIEGMFYRDGALFLGFKAPLMDRQSVILRLSNIDSVIKTGEMTPGWISLWKRVTLKEAGDAIQECISDLFKVSDTLYITGTPLVKKAGTRSGSLWKLDIPTGIVRRIYRFTDFQPEGIAAGKEPGTLMICSDQGGKEPTKVCVVKVNE